MSRTVTLADLRDQIRTVADIQGNTQRLSDAFLNGRINQKLAKMMDILVAQNQDYSLSTYPFTTTVGTDTYSLSFSYYVLRAIRATVAGYKYRIYEFDLQNKPDQDNLNLYPSTSTPFKYRVLGNNIVFSPVPPVGAAVEIDYIPAPTKLVADTDTLDGQAGWEDFILYSVAVDIKNIQNEDSSAFKRSAMEEEARITKMAATRNRSDNRMIQQVNNQNKGWFPFR